MTTINAFFEKYGPWALVSGAAQGLGEAFAIELAQRGFNLLLVDIQAEALNNTANKISLDFNVQIKKIVLDLATPNFMAQLEPYLKNNEVGLLINNAGISRIGDFIEIPLDEHQRIMDINLRAPLLLSHHLGREMAQRKRGGIIFVSSLSALYGTPLAASYAGTKAFNLIMGEALWHEMRGQGVDVLAFPAGTTDTPGWRAGKPKQKPNAAVMNPRQAAREALNALGKKPSLIPGLRNRINFWLLKWLSRKRAVETVGKEMQRLYQ